VAQLLYCNKSARLAHRAGDFQGLAMAPRVASAHRHGPREGHAPAVVAASLLRMGAPARLGCAAVAIALIWAAVVWAMA
jgi:hypothetical protein